MLWEFYVGDENQYQSTRAQACWLCWRPLGIALAQRRMLRVEGQHGEYGEQ
jgi:hypothetical protein